MLVAFGLAAAFTAIWLLGYWPPIFKKVWFWPVLVVGGLLTILAVVFIQLPLQYYVSKGLENIWSAGTLTDWILLASIPSFLISGLVQEGAKLVPVVVWWSRSEKNLDPKMGLVIGAMAGAGMGLIEAFWVHNQLFMAGWSIDYMQSAGFLGIAGFWERFFSIGMHIWASALAGWGLAKGKGWQFFLIAGGIHGFYNWGFAPLQKGYLTITQVELYLAVITIILTAVVMLLRWSKRWDNPVLEPIEPAVPVEPPAPASPVV